MWYWQATLVGLLFTVGTGCVTITDFPQCAQDCINQAAAQLGGDTTDLSFICKSSYFIKSVGSCGRRTCSSSDETRAFRLTVQICEPVGGTSGVSLADLPTCAQPGLEFATKESGCSTTDWTCICKSSAYTVVAAEYEERYCSPRDRQAILDYTSTACAAVGVQLVPPAPGSSNVTSLLTSPETSVFDFPSCAQPCIDAALLQSGCRPTDWNCICINPAFVEGDLAFCELQSCSIQDQYKILNYTNTQCSAIGEALVPATTVSPLSSASNNVNPPLQPATVPLAFPTENVPGSVPQFSNLSSCAQFCLTNATSKSGGSVSDLELLCRSEEVLGSISACLNALCSPTDHSTSFILTGKLCEPVGGIVSRTAIANASAQATLVSALYPTTTAVTNLDTVPPCAKPCLVTAFQQSGCALSDVQCQCLSPAFGDIFLSCQAPTCGILDLQRLLPFTDQRCQAVGITLPASAYSIASDVAYGKLTSTKLLPTPTNLANAPDDVQSLPFCAQECIYEAASRAECDIHNLTCICTNEIYIAYIDTCLTVSCTASELQVTFGYSVPLCAPVKNLAGTIPTGAALRSYLVEATYSAPNPPTVTDAPNNISALPLCAQSCAYSAAAEANCSSINDLTCVCGSPVFVSVAGHCEQATCTEAELEVLSAQVQEVCAPYGGVKPSFTPTPTIQPFFGKAATFRRGNLLYYVAAPLGCLLWAIHI